MSPATTKHLRSSSCSARRRLPLAALVLSIPLLTTDVLAQDRPGRGGQDQAQEAREREPGRPAELPGQARVPDDVREMDEQVRRVGRDPVRQPTLEQVLRELEELGIDVDVARRGPPERPIRPDPEAERELRQMERMERQVERGMPRRPPSVDETLNAIRELPHGREMLEYARQRGARVSGVEPGRVRAILAAVNPFRVRHAWARSASNYSLFLTTSSPESSSPRGRWDFYGARVPSNCCTNHSIFLHDSSSIPLTGHTNLHRRYSVGHATASIGFEVPADGWYAINIRGYSYSSRAELRGWVNKDLVQAWDYRNVSNGWRSYATLAYLGRGWHQFSFHPRDGRIAVRSVSVRSL
jgi:hypothetical protein